MNLEGADILEVELVGEEPKYRLNFAAALASDCWVTGDRLPTTIMRRQSALISATGKHAGERGWLRTAGIFSERAILPMPRQRLRSIPKDSIRWGIVLTGLSLTMEATPIRW